MTIIGYALVELASGVIVDRAGTRLPVRFTVDGVGVCDFDKQGQVMPDSEQPSHMFVERVLAGDPPDGLYETTGETEEFDGTRVVVTRTYEALPDPIPEQISDRQFAHALKNAGLISHAEAMAFVQTGTVPAAIQAVVDSIEDQSQREAAELLLAGATVFERHHPMTEALRVGIGKTSEELDALWIEAAAL